MNNITHVAFLNPQGNFDHDDSHWTEHPDFGGQLVYVKELSKNLAQMGIKVDIITRQINDPEWPEFKDLYDSYPETDNLRIIRLPFAGDKFLKKEDLWPYLKNFIDDVAEFYDEEGIFPEFFSTHFALGGLAGVLLKEKMETPFSFTSHSLGAQQIEKLSFEDKNYNDFINDYNFHKRIIGERLAIKYANQIIVSTEQERYEQYSHPYYKDTTEIENDNKFSVIHPGVNTDLFDGSCKDKTAEMINNYLERDLDKDRLELPCIVASGRLVEKKNHLNLIKAFAEDKELQGLANIVITLRDIENPFEDYSSASEEQKKILDNIMEIIDDAELRAKISIFPISSQERLAELYGYLAEKKSVFSLNSFYESFCLAPLEAMVSGLPAVVTKNGGQKEIMGDDEYGILIDPEDTRDIARGLKIILSSTENWEKYSEKGASRVKSDYTWEETAKKYLAAVEKGLENEIPVDHSDIPKYFFLPDSDNEHKLLEKFYHKIGK